MVFHPAQSEIAKCTKRFRVVNIGRRGGKTSLAIYEMAGKAYSKKNRKICYIAPTYQQARDIAWVELVKVLTPIATKVNETKLEIVVQTQDKGKSKIQLKGWESIETLRGQAFDFIVIDEIASMRNWTENWNEIIRPTLTDTQGECLFISTPKGFNHFYDLYNMENDPVKGVDYKSFHFTSYDNPHLSREELDKSKAELSEDQFAQEYLADFRKQEGLVYKEFDRKRHVIDYFPTKVDEYFAGIDFGFTNPTAVIHIKRDGDQNFFIIDESYKSGRTEEQTAEYVKSCEFNRVYPDPEAPSAIKVLHDKGINVVEVVKNKDSIKNGINVIRNLLKMNKLRIHSSCINLISEFESYAYPDSKGGRNERENPIKDHDHALDALRYALMTNKADNILSPEEMSRLHVESRRNLSSNAR